MAKRYGRNQRRRHRAEIERLSTALAANEATYTSAQRDLWKQLAELRAKFSAWDSDVCSLLGEYSAFRLETGRLKTSDPIYRLPIPGCVPASPRGAKLSDETSASQTMTYLSRLLITGKTHRESLSHLVRLVVERPGGAEELHFAYRVDGRRLLTLGRRDFPWLVDEVANSLYKAVREVGAHG